MSQPAISRGVVTKHDLTSQISKQTGAAHGTVAQIVQLFIDNVTGHLADGHEITLRNFGTFEVRVSRARIGRNPNKPENTVPIPERAAVKFTPGKTLRTRVLELSPKNGETRS